MSQTEQITKKELYSSREREFFSIMNEEVKRSQRSAHELLHESVTRNSSRDKFISAQGAPAPKEEDAEGIFELLSPSASLKAFSDSIGNPDNESLISIIGRVLALQALANTRYWTTSYNLATNEMQAAVRLAPLIGASIINSYNMQAQQSTNQSNESFYNGIISSGAAAVAIGIGVYGAGWGEDASKVTGGGAGFEDEAAAATNASRGVDADLDEELSSTTKAKNVGTAAKDQFAKGGIGKFLKRVFDKALGAAAAAQGMSQIGTSFNDSTWKAKTALAQKAQGLAEAGSKQMEQYAQFYNQLFSRDNEIGNSATQNFIDSTTQLIRSTADTITQTIQSMFRG